MLFTERAVIGDYVCYPRPLDEERDRAVSTPQAAKSSNPYPELPQIHNLRARPISAEEQVVFWDNPYRLDLVGYQLWACHTDRRTDPQPHERFAELRRQDFPWRPEQRYHGVAFRYRFDEPSDLCFLVRVVGAERHGQFVGTHLAGRYRSTISLSTLQEHHRAPVLKVGIGENRHDESQAVTIPQDWWAGSMVWTLTAGIEEIVHHTRGDSLIEKEVDGQWEPVPTGLRKRSRIGAKWGNFTRHGTIPRSDGRYLGNLDDSPCTFARLVATESGETDL